MLKIYLCIFPRYTNAETYVFFLNEGKTKRLAKRVINIASINKIGDIGSGSVLSVRTIVSCSVSFEISTFPYDAYLYVVPSFVTSVLFTNPFSL